MMNIGFLDYYLDNWHANEYVRRIADISEGKLRVAYAYGAVANIKSGVTSEKWCERHGVGFCATIEEVVDKSDVLYILSPEYPQMHEPLAQLALRSGKRTFIDKTFAPNRKTAEAIFEIAEAFGTPCYSASALRFAEEYPAYMGKNIDAAAFLGPGEIQNYLIHHIEPLLMLMGGRVKKVMALCYGSRCTFVLRWRDGRCATLSMTGEYSAAFMDVLGIQNGFETVAVNSDFHAASLRQLIHFYQDGKIPVQHIDTIHAIAVREACLQAAVQGEGWKDVL